MSNIITIEFCPEDRKRLDELIGMAGWIAGALKDMTAPSVLEMDGNGITLRPAYVEQPDPVTEHPVDEVSPHAIPEPVAEPELPKYTKEDILAKVQSIAATGSTKRDKAKAIVQTYGTKVSDIPEDKYDEVMAQLTALEG